jgi:polysaccharide biosynthesis transport protein
MEHRSPTVDYFAVVRRRFLWLVTPVVLGIIVGAALVMLLPREYVSSATLAIATPRVSGELSRTTPLALTERIRAVSHALLSRPVVERVAREEGLLKEKPVEEVVSEIRTRTTISLPEKTLTNTGKLDPDTFVVAYSGPTPERAQRITARLTEVFIAANSQERESRAEETAAFLAEQVREAKERLDRAEANLQQLKASHSGVLPEQALANVQIVSDLRQQADSNSLSLRGERDRLAVVEQQIAAMQEESEVAATTAIEEKTQEPVKALEQQLSDARQVYTSKHPEIQRLEAELATARSAAAASQAAAKKPRTVSDPAYRQLLAERDSLRIRMRDFQSAGSRISRELAQYQARIDATPAVEQQLTAVTRELEFAKDQYQRLAERHQNAKLAEDLERQRAGEQFTILYPASLPAAPSKPNVPMVLAFSLVGGVAVGGALAAARELFDRSVYDARAIQHEFNCPVLAEIPRLRRSWHREAA